MTDSGRQIAQLSQALYDLLDTLERGDGYRQRERMITAGQLLSLTRYNEEFEDLEGSGSMEP